jgi:DNA polymerase III delta subunit
MIIYLYGPDGYRRNQKLRELVGRYKEKYADADFLDVDLGGDSHDWVRVRDFVGQPSLFVATKLAVVCESGNVTVKAWRDLLKGALDDTSLFIIISDAKSAKKDFKFLLEDPVKSQEFPVLEGKKLEAFVAREARARGLGFAPDARGFFFDYTESFKDERAPVVVNTLDQVSLANYGNPITVDCLKQVVVWEKADEIFPLALRLLKAAPGMGRLEQLEAMFAGGYTSSHILNLLCAVVRGREDTLALAEADEYVKSGALDDQTALTGFALGAT